MKGREDRNTDARVNIADDPSTSDKKLGELWSSNPEFCGLHTGLCQAFLAYYLLIYVFV